jgi:hypothetical protein
VIQRGCAEAHTASASGRLRPVDPVDEGVEAPGVGDCLVELCEARQRGRRQVAENSPVLNMAATSSALKSLGVSLGAASPSAASANRTIFAISSSGSLGVERTSAEEDLCCWCGPPPRAPPPKLSFLLSPPPGRVLPAGGTYPRSRRPLPPPPCWLGEERLPRWPGGPLRRQDRLFRRQLEVHQTRGHADDA